MTAIATLGWWPKEPVPQSIAEATQWAPAAVLEPRLADSVMTVPKTTQVGGARKILNVPLLQPDVTETALPAIEPPLVTWTRQIASGET
ncbi:MAG: M23 family peptidase, partial [Paracoccaceae bacterium]